MAYKCENCEKGIMYGHNVSHSKRRTNRTFKPNLQMAKIIVAGREVRARLCTKCIKLSKKIQREKAEVVAEAAVAATA
jgi:large subunit ribosomal protein L28